MPICFNPWVIKKNTNGKRLQSSTIVVNYTNLSTVSRLSNQTNFGYPDVAFEATKLIVFFPKPSIDSIYDK